MPIDPSFPLRRGDVVSIRGTVAFTPTRDGASITIDLECGMTAYADRFDVDLVRTALEPGDRVELIEASIDRVPPGVVKHVIDDKAWIEWLDGETVEEVDALRRLPPEPVPDEDPGFAEIGESEPVRPTFQPRVPRLVTEAV